MTNLRTCVITACVLFTVSCASSSTTEITPLTTTAFEQRLQDLATQYHIPGMAAVIEREGAILWSHGFGEAHTSEHVPATTSSIFHLASLTKTFASVVVLQLVQEGRIGLDDPVSKYGVALPNADAVLVRHLLSHTSEGTPGTQFRYNGDRFGLLDGVLKSATGKPFATLVTERVIRPLGLMQTGPGNMRSAHDAGLDTASLRGGLAQGYASNGADPIAYPPYMGTAAGMISSAHDMAIYAHAIDGNSLMTEENRTRAFTPVQSTNGTTLPYGLGWFVTSYQGETLVWHYGLWTGNSSLIIKVPARNVSFVLLANSAQLSEQFRLGAGDLLSSPFARSFLGWLEGTTR